jgi:hypothetical protein
MIDDDDDDDDCGTIGGMRIVRGNRSTLRKPHSVPFSPIKNPTRLDLESNPGRRGGKPETSRLSYAQILSALEVRSFQRRSGPSGEEERLWIRRALNSGPTSHRLVTALTTLP